MFKFLVLSVFVFAVACQKKPEQRQEANQQPEAVVTKAADEAIKKTKIECETKVVRLDKEGKVKTTSTSKQNSVKETKKTTDSEITYTNSTSTGDFYFLTLKSENAGPDVKTYEMSYSRNATTETALKKIEANTYEEKYKSSGKKTAKEGFFFEDKDRKKVKEQEFNLAYESTFFDDGKMTKMLSYKDKDGNVTKAFEIKYYYEEKTEGDVTTYFEYANEYTDDEGEKVLVDETKCVSTKL